MFNSFHKILFAVVGTAILGSITSCNLTQSKDYDPSSIFYGDYTVCNLEGQTTGGFFFLTKENLQTGFEDNFIESNGFSDDLVIVDGALITANQEGGNLVSFLNESWIPPIEEVNSQKSPKNQKNTFVEAKALIAKANFNYDFADTDNLSFTVYEYSHKTCETGNLKCAEDYLGEKASGDALDAIVVASPLLKDAEIDYEKSIISFSLSKEDCLTYKDDKTVHAFFVPNGIESYFLVTDYFITRIYHN